MRWPGRRRTRCRATLRHCARRAAAPPLAHDVHQCISSAAVPASRLQATEYHLGQLKARLAKLRTELQAPSGKVRPALLPPGPLQQ